MLYGGHSAVLPAYQQHRARMGASQLRDPQLSRSGQLPAARAQLCRSCGSEKQQSAATDAISVAGGGMRKPALPWPGWRGSQTERLELCIMKTASRSGLLRSLKNVWLLSLFVVVIVGTVVWCAMTARDASLPPREKW
jgi:hypothetical protein